MSPWRVLAPTVITPLQLAGAKLIASSLALPAATTITAPCASAVFTPSWNDCGHEPSPPRLMLITRAGLGFSGTPTTGTPAAHTPPPRRPSHGPPHCPNRRTARRLELQS